MHLDYRSIIRVHGKDTLTFLQGLMTQDVLQLKSQPAIYGAFLNPQGRFLFDAFISHAPGGEDSYFLECGREKQDDLLQYLIRYRLRAQVSFEPLPYLVQVTLPEETSPSQTICSFEDPRVSELGMRHIVASADENSSSHVYEKHRMSLGVPEGSKDLEYGRSIVLEYGFQDLHGIHWSKGCYVGQELMSRTHHLGEVRKRLLPFRIKNPSTFSNDLFLMEEREVASLRSLYDEWALALVRLEALPFLQNQTEFFDVIIPTWVNLNKEKN